MPFCHLHLHNEYSVLDGVGTSKQYAQLATELGQEYLAITNHGNVDGAIRHQKDCLAAGIIPIIGCELYIVDNIKTKDKAEKKYHITVLVKNDQGWQNLLSMLTIAHLEGFYYKPRIDPQILLDHCEGLIILTGCQQTFINMIPGPELLDALIKKTGRENIFLEVMPHQTDEQKKLNKRIIGLSKKLKVGIVATNDCHYPAERSAKYQEVLLAIQSKKKWADPSRWKFNVTGLYLKSEEEMKQAFSEQGILSKGLIRIAINNTVKIGKLTQGFTIKRQQVDLPTIKDFKDIESEKHFFSIIVNKGFNVKFRSLPKDQKKIYADRLDEEMQLINKMGFEKYFLLVWDLIRWCDKNDILVGPGRGSVGGSLVAYVLGITQVDPIQHGLMFFRFISPERIDLPDIDIDFERHKINQVHNYLKDKYGEYSVAGLTAFSTMKGKGVIRDVSRVFDVSLREVDPAAKAINDDNKNNQQIKESFSVIPECVQFKKKYPEVVEIAGELEGQVRTLSQHAAAICISKNDLRSGHHCNLAKRNKAIVANWDKDDSEYMGLMKLDILKLAELSVLNECRKMVKKNHDINIDLRAIPLDDPEIYKWICAGNTLGAFQISTRGLTEFCKNLKVGSFEVLSAATALFRPGPLHTGMGERFIAIKNGKQKIEKIHPIYDRITEETFGIIIYQEQVMRMAHELAGMDMAECDKMRKIIGKTKGTAALNKYRKQFIQGCINNKTVNKQIAEKIWKTIETFGGYGFNKAHSVEYSVITVWDMWMKINYPHEFLACCLTYGNKERSSMFIREARRLGMKVKLPKIGRSHATDWIADKDGNLFAPFICVDGIGPATAVILAKKNNQVKRRKGFFKSTNQATKINGVNKKVDAILQQIGAYDPDKEFTPKEYMKIKHLFSF